MKTKNKFTFGNLKSTNSTSYIDHEKIDILTKYPTIKKVIDFSDIKLIDLPKLQIETEQIISNLGYRISNIKSLLEGHPKKPENGLIKNLNNSNQYFQYFAFPNDEKLKLITEEKIEVKNNDEEFITKSISEKPLTLIISNQNYPKTRNNLNNKKRKIIDEDEINIELKRQKITPIKNNNKIEKDIKPNYEIPNKFWELMEPYCAEINEEHIQTLEDYIKSYENDAKYYELPTLDELPESRTEKLSLLRRQCHQNDNGNHLNGFVDNKGSVELSNLLKKIDDEISYFYRKPLSQTKTLKTFPQTFVNKMSQDTDELIESHKLIIKDSKNAISSEASGISKSLAKQLKVSNGYKIEKHIKKSMEDLGMCNFNLPFIPKLEPQFNLCNESDEQGIAKSSEADIIDPMILNSNDFITLQLPSSGNCKKKVDNNNVKEDKALLGLRRRQGELKLVSESNLGMLRRLLVAAKKDMKRQEIERRLAVADADVIDSYNVIESYRPTRKPPLKKDRDAAYKALKERQKILKELDAFDIEFV